jgi:hypothetical protein
MVQVKLLGMVDAENNPATVTIDSIIQDEPAGWIKSKSPDGSGVGTDTAKVRAKRLGNSNGRVYAITYTASDGKGGTCNGAVSICVPYNMDRGNSCIDDGQINDSTENESL